MLVVLGAVTVFGCGGSLDRRFCGWYGMWLACLVFGVWWWFLITGLFENWCWVLLWCLGVGVPWIADFCGCCGIRLLVFLGLLFVGFDCFVWVGGLDVLA